MAPLLVVTLMLPTSAMAAEPTVNLGTTETFAILAYSGIMNTGTTVITGDVGSAPTPAMTGFGSVTLDGETHANDAVAILAKTDLVTAYNDAVGRTVTSTLASPELGGLTLGPGVYTSGDALSITGTLTLDAYHSSGQRRPTHQRCPVLPGLLAGGEFGDFGHELDLRGTHLHRSEHPGGDWREGGGAAAGNERCCHA